MLTLIYLITGMVLSSFDAIMGTTNMLIAGKICCCMDMAGAVVELAFKSTRSWSYVIVTEIDPIKHLKQEWMVTE